MMPLATALPDPHATCLTILFSSCLSARWMITKSKWVESHFAWSAVLGLGENAWTAFLGNHLQAFGLQRKTSPIGSNTSVLQGFHWQLLDFFRNPIHRETKIRTNQNPHSSFINLCCVHHVPHVTIKDTKVGWQGQCWMTGLLFPGLPSKITL